MIGQLASQLWGSGGSQSTLLGSTTQSGTGLLSTAQATPSATSSSWFDSYGLPTYDQTKAIRPGYSFDSTSPSEAYSLMGGGAKYGFQWDESNPLTPAYQALEKEFGISGAKNALNFGVPDESGTFMPSEQYTRALGILDQVIKDNPSIVSNLKPYDTESDSTFRNMTYASKNYSPQTLQLARQLMDGQSPSTWEQSTYGTGDGLSFGRKAVAINPEDAKDYIISSLSSGKEVPLQDMLYGSYQANEIIPRNPVASQLAENYSSLYGTKATGELMNSLGSQLGLTDEEINKVAGAVSAKKYAIGLENKTSGWDMGQASANANDWTNALLDYAKSKGVNVSDELKTQAATYADKINTAYSDARRIESNTGGIGDLVAGFADLAPIIQMIPGGQPIAAGLSAYAASRNGNWLGAGLSLLGASGALDSLPTSDFVKNISNSTGLDPQTIAGGIKGAISNAGNGLHGAAIGGLLGGVGSAAGNAAAGMVGDSDLAKIANGAVQALVKSGYSLYQAQQIVETAKATNTQSTGTSAQTVPTDTTATPNQYSLGPIARQFWSN